jgi:hypothetical protein
MVNIDPQEFREKVLWAAFLSEIGRGNPTRHPTPVFSCATLLRERNYIALQA